MGARRPIARTWSRGTSAQTSTDRPGSAVLKATQPALRFPRSRRADLLRTPLCLAKPVCPGDIAAKPMCKLISWCDNTGLPTRQHEPTNDVRPHHRMPLARRPHLEIRLRKPQCFYEALGRDMLNAFCRSIVRANRLTSIISLLAT